MKKILFVLLFLNCSIAIANFEAVTEFQKAIIDEEITGSNVAMVYQDGKSVYYHAQNSLKPGDKSITPQTIFPIWSMSKPITIVAMMTLHEKGLVKFDDPVSKYIPQFANIKCKGENGPYPCKNELKIVHLMTHRSGYQYYGNPHNFTYTFKYDNLEDFVDDVAKHPLEFEPGEKYMYGINQAILGRVVEVVTGKSFYEYLKEILFDPLGMKDTKFYLTNGERSSRFQPLFINAGNLKGYTNLLDEMTYDIDNRAYFGGEGLVSTIMDYSKFCTMLLNGGSFEGRKIISPKSIGLMTRKYSEGFPIEENASPEALGFHYGFSLFVLDDPKVDGVNATKGIYGWSGYHNTHFWIDPEKNLFGLFMSRAREFSWEVQKRFRKSVYSSLD